MFPYGVKYTESEYDIQNNDYYTKYTKNTQILNIYPKLNRRFTPQNRHAQTFPDTQTDP